MIKIILTSSFSDVADDVNKLISNDEPKTVAFFDTASKVEKVKFYVKKAKKWFENNNFAVVDIDVEKESLGEIKVKIAGCSIIYVSGGNTFYLLQEFKNKGIDQLIINHVQSGKTYIGESAGAMIAAANITYASLMDSPDQAPKLTEFSALNLIRFYPIPHFNNMPFKGAVKKIIKKYETELDLLPISNHQYIFVW